MSKPRHVWLAMTPVAPVVDGVKCKPNISGQGIVAVYAAFKTKKAARELLGKYVELVEVEHHDHE